MATLRNAKWTAIACGLLLAAMHPEARAEGEFTVGGQWFDQSVPEAKFQEFREVRRGAFVESFLLREWSGRNSLALWGSNAIRTDQSSRLAWANGARWRVDLGYQQIPHTFSQIARWGWHQSVPGTFTLPDSLQARNQALPTSYTQRMIDFLQSGAPGVQLGFATKNATARVRARPARGWQFEARGTHRNRLGIKPYAMSFGFSTALENPEPIDQRMVDADLVADYRRDRFNFQASGGLSVFENRIDELRVDNPKRLTDVLGGDGAAVGVLDLYPDNRVVRGSLAMSYALPRHSAVTATLGLAEGRQDDRFLGFSNNSAMPQSSRDSLPAQSLDAKVRQLNGDLRFTTRPAEKLDGAVHFNYTDYDNRTPELNFIGQAPYEASFQRFIEFHNHVLSNTRWTTGIDLGYAITPRIKLGGIAEYRVRERTHREVEKDTEKLFGGKLRLMPADGLWLNGLYTRGDREADAFHVEDYFGLKTRTAIGSTPNLYDSLGLVEQPGLRRFDVADRIQDRVSAEASYVFGERLDLSATYSFFRNDFSRDTTLGLQKDQLHSVASSATLHWNERIDLSGGFGLGRGRTFQRSRTSSSASVSFNPVNNWTADIEEKEVFAFGGASWMPPGRFSVDAEYVFSRSKTDYDLADGANTAVDLPNTTFHRHETQLNVGYRWLSGTSIIGRWAWEDYGVDDFASNNVPFIFPQTGTANAIFLGDSSQGYRAHRLAVLLKHTF